MSLAVRPVPSGGPGKTRGPSVVSHATQKHCISIDNDGARHTCVQVSFGGLGLKVTDAQLLEAAQSMMAEAIAAKHNVPIHIARESVRSGSLSTALSDSISECVR